MGWCFSQQGSADADSGYSSWYLMFREKDTEDAFLGKRHDRMIVNSRRLSLVLVLCMLPDFARYTHREFQYRDRDAYYAEHPDRSGGPNGEAGTRQHILLGVALLVFLSVVLLTSLSCTRRRIRFRCWEAFWACMFCTGVMFVQAGAFHDLTLERCLFNLHRMTGAGCSGAFAEPVEFCYKSTCNDCDGSELAVKLRLALALDVFVTVIHLALPVRWAIMVPLDVLVMVSFFVLSRHRIQGERSASQSAALELYVPMLMSLLTSGANFGLRQQERHERDFFMLLADERVQRAKAEYAAHTAQRASNATLISRHADAASEGKSARSAPTTTPTGRLFSQVGKTGAESRDILQRLLDLGKQQSWMIGTDELTIDYSCILGRGSFGVVVEGRFCCGPVAVKILETDDRESRMSFFNEVRILRTVRHPNIALFHGACFCSTDSDIKLVMERVYGVTLGTWVAKQKPPMLGVLEGRACVMQGLCHALAYLHSRKPRVVHADLKPSNVMVEMLESGPRSKLLDFGVSGLLTRTAVLTGGTLDYMAPEVRSNPDAKPSPAVDIFAFGRILACMARAPMHGASESDNEIVAKTLLDKWTGVIKTCSDINPAKRPTTTAIHAELWGGAAPDGRRTSTGDSAPASALRTEASESAEDAVAALRAEAPQWTEDAAFPSTLLSRRLERVTVDELHCSAEILPEMLLSLGDDWHPQMLGTLSAAIELCLEHARGPALVLIAEKDAFRAVFCDDEDGESSATPKSLPGPTMWTADRGYMTGRLRSRHISDPRFAKAFGDFTDSSHGGYWPQDYPDQAARMLKKGGALVLDATGYRLRCAARISGLPAPPAMPRRASKMYHTALACVWAVSPCVALVRDSDGSLDGIVWLPSDARPHVYRTPPLSSYPTREGGGREGGGLSL